MSEKLAIDGGTPVRTKPLPWPMPGTHWYGDEEIAALEAVIRAKSPFRFAGPDPQRQVQQLEETMARRIGRKHAVACASGTNALGVALGALGVGPGDEVLLPGYLWVSCLSAIVRLGAIPRLVDIDDTFCMCPKDLERKIGPRSKVLMLIHMSGAPGELDAQMAVARKAGLKVLEDCCQANGASYHGKPVGAFGDLAVFSFQVNKNATAGEGGIVLCDDDELYTRCFAIHDLGYARNDQRGTQPEDERYLLWGMGTRMSEPNGALALAQVRKLDQIVRAMRGAKWRIREALEDIDGLRFRRIVDPAGDSGPFLIATFDTPEICAQFVAALRAEGIQGPAQACIPMTEWHLHWYCHNPSLGHRASLSPSGWPWTDPANQFAADYDYARGALPTCDDLESRSMLLTIASCLTNEDTEDIIAAFRKVAAAILQPQRV